MVQGTLWPSEPYDVCTTYQITGSTTTMGPLAATPWPGG